LTGFAVGEVLAAPGPLVAWGVTVYVVDACAADVACHSREGAACGAASLAVAGCAAGLPAAGFGCRWKEDYEE
jgi:hypothetical protein